MAASGGIDVSIIVISYNTLAMTKAALDSVSRETSRVTYEVIAVDNASTDGSADMIAAHPLKPHLIASPINHGFAAANNLAAKQAKGRYLLLLNPDTVILDGAIDKLVAFAAERPQAKIWGGRTRFGDLRLNPQSCWQRMTAWNLFCRASGLAALFKSTSLFNGEAIGGWQRDSVRDVDIVVGCFLLIERSFWTELGGFDPAFFMYGEEADLCLRAKKLGARPAITPEATIIHYGGASERIRADKMVRLLSGKVMLIDRHWSRATAPFGKALLAAWPLGRAVATSVIALFKPSVAPAAETWRTIWRRRAEWIAGYKAELHSPTLKPLTA